MSPGVALGLLLALGTAFASVAGFLAVGTPGADGVAVLVTPLAASATARVVTASSLTPRPWSRTLGNDPELHSRHMLILIVGCGRVGSAVAKRALEAGHEVSVLDQDPLSHERLDRDQTSTWEDAGGRYTVGAAPEIDGLIEAGIEQADVFLAATRGDNTNLVIAQIAQRRFDVPRVVVRVADPARAGWYAQQGLHTICPTQIAIDQAMNVALAPAEA